MEEKEVSIDNPVVVTGVTLIPVAELSLNGWQGSGGLSFFGIKQPIAVLVVSPSTKRAFRISGEEVPLEQFLQEVPGIKEILLET